MKRRVCKCTIILISLLLVALLVGCGSKKTGSKKDLAKIIISEFRSLSYAGVHIADHFGYYEDVGLDVEFAVYGDGPIAFQGMHAGSSQFCMLSIDPVFRAFDEGVKSSIIAGFDTTRLYGFVGSKDITHPSQLKGKVVFAGAPGSAPYSFIWSVLEEAGLNPAQDITFAQMQYGASIVALERGTIDASYMDHYNRNKFLAVGANILVDGADAETKRIIFGSERFEGSIITATTKYVKENPEVVQKFMEATLKGVDWVHAHTNEEIVEVLSKYHDGMNREELLERLDLIRFAYSTDLRITKEGFNAMENFTLKTGVIKNRIGYDNIIDMSFVEKIHAKK